MSQVEPLLGLISPGVLKERILRAYWTTGALLAGTGHELPTSCMAMGLFSVDPAARSRCATEECWRWHPILHPEKVMEMLGDLVCTSAEVEEVTASELTVVGLAYQAAHAVLVSGPRSWNGSVGSYGSYSALARLVDLAPGGQGKHILVVAGGGQAQAGEPEYELLADAITSQIIYALRVAGRG